MKSFVGRIADSGRHLYERVKRMRNKTSAAAAAPPIPWISEENDRELLDTVLLNLFECIIDPSILGPKQNALDVVVDMLNHFTCYVSSQFHTSLRELFYQSIMAIVAGVVHKRANRIRMTTLTYQALAPTIVGIIASPHGWFRYLPPLPVTMAVLRKDATIEIQQEHALLGFYKTMLVYSVGYCLQCVMKGAGIPMKGDGVTPELPHKPAVYCGVDVSFHMNEATNSQLFTASVNAFEREVSDMLTAWLRQRVMKDLDYYAPVCRLDNLDIMTRGTVLYLRRTRIYGPGALTTHPVDSELRRKLVAFVRPALPSLPAMPDINIQHMATDVTFAQFVTIVTNAAPIAGNTYTKQEVAYVHAKMLQVLHDIVTRDDSIGDHTLLELVTHADQSVFSAFSDSALHAITGNLQLLFAAKDEIRAREALEAIRVQLVDTTAATTDKTEATVAATTTETDDDHRRKKRKVDRSTWRNFIIAIAMTAAVVIGAPLSYIMLGGQRMVQIQTGSDTLRVPVTPEFSNIPTIPIIPPTQTLWNNLTVPGSSTLPDALSQRNTLPDTRVQQTHIPPRQLMIGAPAATPLIAPPSGMLATKPNDYARKIMEFADASLQKSAGRKSQLAIVPDVDMSHFNDPNAINEQMNAILAQQDNSDTNGVGYVPTADSNATVSDTAITTDDAVNVTTNTDAHYKPDPNRRKMSQFFRKKHEAKYPSPEIADNVRLFVANMLGIANRLGAPNVRISDERMSRELFNITGLHMHTRGKFEEALNVRLTAESVEAWFSSNDDKQAFLQMCHQIYSARNPLPELETCAAFLKERLPDLFPQILATIQHGSVPFVKDSRLLVVESDGWTPKRLPEAQSEPSLVHFTIIVYRVLQAIGLMTTSSNFAKVIYKYLHSRNNRGDPPDWGGPDWEQDELAHRQNVATRRGDSGGPDWEQDDGLASRRNMATRRSPPPDMPEMDTASGQTPPADTSATNTMRTPSNATRKRTFADAFLIKENTQNGMVMRASRRSQHRSSRRSSRSQR